MIIDAHTHIFPERFRNERADVLERDRTFRELFSGPSSKLATADELLSVMDETGVQVSVIAGIGWENLEVAREANENILDVCSRHPNRFIGLASINPAWGDSAVTELLRCIDSGISGIGELHPGPQGFELDDFELVASLVEVAESHNLPLLVHSSEPVGHDYPGKGAVTPEVLLSFISHFPSAQIICAHWGGGLPFYTLMPEVQELLKNVYFDSAATPFLYDSKIFRVVESLVGPEKLLFASDYPLIQPLQVIDQIVGTGFSSNSQELILGHNAARLFGLRI
jgi:predicted TIM-barrel fold metal-dependent hydrolase